MTKAPTEFKQMNLQGYGNPLESMFQFIAKIFTDGKALEDELHSMCAVTLIISIIENLGEGVSSQINTINQFYLEELGRAETNNYKNMIVQGIMMNFWYD
jgi:hypothetical protein